LTTAPAAGTIAPDMSTYDRSNNIAAALFGSVRQRVLALLFAGLVTRTPRGNQVFYQANEKSPVFPEVRGLIMKTVGLADVLGECLSSLAGGIEVAFVYGSMADGTHQAGSDVDLMVIGKVGVRQLSQLLSEAQQQLGREINPVTISPAELQERFSKGDHFITAVLQRPRIFVIGDEDELARIAEEAEAGS